VGTWAVQIAKSLGAQVTAVCSTRNVEMVRGLGADEVIDYSTQDFVAGGARFDAMLDLVGNRSLRECKSVLVPGGKFLPCSGGGGDWVGPFVRILAGLASFAFSGKSFKMFVNMPNAADLQTLKDLVESGKARPVIERTYSLAETGAALAHVGAGHSRGQVVIQISGAGAAR
jgi:NADPH:quinone reductase-like Zn-dependent oxidoreductase